MIQEKNPIPAQNKVRIVTATSLFDGHDAAINIMRRILQATGAEVIHLGHNRSAQEVVTCAIAEDVNAIALTSYQGGHVEYFRYIRDLLDQNGHQHVKLFGGGGGVILPDEIDELHRHGITKIYSPDDGRALGLQGMINDLIQKSDFPVTQAGTNPTLQAILDRDPHAIARAITLAEQQEETPEAIEFLESIRKSAGKSSSPVLGVTGTGGAGKSSLIDEFVRRYLHEFPEKTLGIVSVDPSKRKTGGALLGDRIRMNSIYDNRVYMRSLATRQSNLALAKHVHDAVSVLKAANFDLIILETSGIGQSDTEIVDHSDAYLYVMTPEYGAATQLEKIDMIDYADIIAINKFDRRGAADALRDVKKQFRRANNRFDLSDAETPVFGTIASQFNDPGTNLFFEQLMKVIEKKTGISFPGKYNFPKDVSQKIHIIPPDRTRYLSEISSTVRKYNSWVEAQAKIAEKLQAFEATIAAVSDSAEAKAAIQKKIAECESEFDPKNRNVLQNWPQKKQRYSADEYEFSVRGKKLQIATHTKSLSGTKIPRVSLPEFSGWGDILKWSLQENVPGEYPYTAGVFPFKREGEDPTRMFAGEGGPERTNRRFHYVSHGMPAQRLSTAFDSVTLYGDDPDYRPDIFGKIGNSGVSVCCLDDAKKLYSGFNLCSPTTSVSMTINGPAPLLLGFFLNAAIDQQCELYIREHGLEKSAQAKIDNLYKDKKRPKYQGELPEGNDGLGLFLLGITGDQVLPADIYDKIRSETLQKVRGTIQADILKEDQAQNTCIFSTEFSLKLMGDVQEYFVDNNVQNFYSVSISGYHIAEAGANPISQLAFTLANGFTYVEYYLARKMPIDRFAPNLSFFFSNGVDPEYAVIGRVARRIWSKAMKHLYSGDERSQKLKYHIQTSGRSLHAQEIAFNDIRTTLQALYAIFDNCNSLHTNAYDEAITTPTEESVRRAIAIQLIINQELGLAKNQNPLQGSFIIEKLTDLVEEAVLLEFDKITERGGVLGAMETMYQRGKIQEESMLYETLKHTGEYPIVGVNTYLSKEGSPTVLPAEVIRSTEVEKKQQIDTAVSLRANEAKRCADALARMTTNAIANKNLFYDIMEASKFATLGSMTKSLYDVGGRYRRNM